MHKKSALYHIYIAEQVTFLNHRFLIIVYHKIIVCQGGPSKKIPASKHKKQPLLYAKEVDKLGVRPCNVTISALSRDWF